MIHFRHKPIDKNESKYKRLSRIYYNRMFPKRQDALKVAWSVAAGVFIGIWPTIGIAIILTVAFCAVFRLPKVPGIVASFVANPLTQFGFFYPAGYAIGCSLLKPEKINFDFLSEFEGLSFKNFISVITHLWHDAAGHLAAFMVGITIVAAIGGAIFFVLAYFIVNYRKKKWMAGKTSYIQNLIAEDEALIKEAHKGKHPMMHIYPFKALRPVNPAEAETISALPYDVMNRAEAKAMAEGLPHSYLRVTRAELELPDSVDAYDPKVYAHARENLDKMIADGVIAYDKKPCLYVYRQTMNGREQYGLVCCVPAADYFNGIIKKHELTRADKEEDRLRHVLATNANTGPVFLTYRDQVQFDVFGAVTKRKPVYDFVSKGDGFGHTVWIIDDDAEIEAIRKSFEAVPVSYIADGHHRSAAGARAASYRAEQNPNNTGDEEYNRYLAILFPSTQLKILDYNRVLKDLNGRTPEQLMNIADAGEIMPPKSTWFEPKLRDGLLVHSLD